MEAEDARQPRQDRLGRAELASLLGSRAAGSASDECLAQLDAELQSEGAVCAGIYTEAPGCALYRAMDQVVQATGGWNDAVSVTATPTFEEFFETERARLLRVMSMVTGRRAEAEDIVQDAFLQVWERWDRVRSMEDPVAYLNRVAINGFRSRGRRALVAIRKVARPAPEPDVFEAVDAQDVMMRALAALSPRQRAAIVLTELWDFTPEQAGRLLGVKASTVRALTFQGRSALKSMRESSDV